MHDSDRVDWNCSHPVTVFGPSRRAASGIVLARFAFQEQ